MQTITDMLMQKEIGAKKSMLTMISDESFYKRLRYGQCIPKKISAILHNGNSSEYCSKIFNIISSSIEIPPSSIFYHIIADEVCHFLHTTKKPQRSIEAFSIFRLNKKIIKVSNSGNTRIIWKMFQIAGNERRITKFSHFIENFVRFVSKLNFG